MNQPQIIIRTYIAATPRQVWDALTIPEITEKYWRGTRIESDWQVGSPIVYRRDGLITEEHLVLTVEPGRLLRHTFHPVLADRIRKEAPSTVSFEIGDLGTLICLTLTHRDFAENSIVFRACSETWPMVLSSLKTLLETGRPLPSCSAAAASENKPAASPVDANAGGAVHRSEREASSTSTGKLGANKIPGFNGTQHFIDDQKHDEWSI